MLTSWFYQSLPLFSFVLHSFLHYCVVTICGSTASWLHGRLSNCSDCRSVYHAILLLIKFCKMLSNTENRAWSPFCLFTVTHRSHGEHAVTSESSVFPYSDKRRYFSCSSLSIMLCNKGSIHEYKAYWHMNFSLINGCGTHKNNICGHSFFWSGTSEFTNIIIATKKVSKQV